MNAISKPFIAIIQFQIDIFVRLHVNVLTADFRIVGQKVNGKWRDVIANGNTVQ